MCSEGLVRTDILTIPMLFRRANVLRIEEILRPANVIASQYCTVQDMCTSASSHARIGWLADDGPTLNAGLEALCF